MDRSKRLGSMRAGAADIKSHKWFKTVDWTDVYNKKLKPPIVPKVKILKIGQDGVKSK